MCVGQGVPLHFLFHSLHESILTMAPPTSISQLNLLHLLLFLSLFLTASAVRTQKDFHLTSATNPRFPQGQAERLIKALNLLPGAAEDAESSVSGPRLQEKRIRLDVEGDAGISTEELGQYAGYFKLERTHAAK